MSNLDKEREGISEHVSLPSKSQVMKFEDYHFVPELTRAIHEQGWRRPTDIQYRSITNVLNGEDLLAVAQTGTGKTAAFAIPLIQLIEKQKRVQRRQDGLKCIVLAPTHELVSQLVEVFEGLCKYTTVEVTGLYGGVKYDDQIVDLKNRVDIVVATPGRLFDLMSQGYVIAHRVSRLVLDEADHMLDLGFIHDIRQLVANLPGRQQTLFYSATINEKIKKIAYSLIKQSAIRIQISPKNPIAGNIHHTVAFMEMDDKRFFLERLIREHEEDKVMVFVRTMVRAERVKKAMERVGIASLCLHRDVDQNEREASLDLFKQGVVTVLISTDLSARGIDVDNVRYVVNYDLPEQPENYVHRVGRTGRMRKKGEAVSFCSPDERPLLKEIEEYTGEKIEVLNIEGGDYQETILFSEQHDTDWRKLMELSEELDAKSKKKKVKKKRK